MSDQLSVLVLNGDAETNQQFEKLQDAQLTTANLNGDGWNETLRRHPLDILVVELNPKADVASSMARIERARADYPEMTIFVTSATKSPELIIAAMRSGAQEFLSKPISEGELNQAVDRCRRRKESTSGRSQSGRLISVFSKTGGVGVTTLAVNLGVALAQTGSNRAALVDLNLQHGDASSLLDLHPRYSIVDACEAGDHVDTDKLQSCMTPHASGLSLLAEPAHPASSDDVSAHHVHSVLQQLTGIYPYVIVDMPHVFEPRVMAALDMSSTILLTTVATIPALRAARKVLALFKELGFSHEKVKLVVNRVSRVDRIETKEITRTLDHEPFWTLPNNYLATADALNTGQPLVSQKRLSNVAKSLLDMADVVSRVGVTGRR